MQLRDYQLQISNQALDKLESLGMVYLSMEVRTGKTLTAIATAARYAPNGKALFVTKKKAIKDVLGQAEAYDADLDTFNCINYESVHKLEDELEDLDVIILDEAHGLGAFPKPTGKFKRIKAILDKKSNKNTRVIFLSGTPSPESYSQLYHQFAVSKYYNPFRAYTSFYKWANTFVNKKQKYLGHGNPVNDYSEAKKDLIDNALKDYFISFSQGEAGFTVEVLEEVLEVEMKPITYKMIDTLRKYNVLEGKEKVVLADTGVKLQSKIHQLCSGTIKFEDGDTQCTDDSKAVFIKQRFSNNKIAIFYKFKAEFDLLKEHFPNYTTEPTEFNSSEDLVFLGQIQSVREGINLSTADFLVMYNIDFSAVSYWQGRDRLSTKDRTKENKVYWIFSKRGIEKKVYNAVMNKKDYTLEYFKQDFPKEQSDVFDNDARETKLEFITPNRSGMKPKDSKEFVTKMGTIITVTMKTTRISGVGVKDFYQISTNGRVIEPLQWVGVINHIKNN